MNSNFIKPKYDRDGFVNIIPAIQESLVSQKYDAVVLFLIDGFGCRFVDKFQSESFLSEVLKNGEYRKYTSQFPSTTTVHITTLHTGQTVGEHGFYEWFYYEPEIDKVISPLLFSPAGISERDFLKKDGVKPRKIFPQNDFYHSLRRQGVFTTIFQHHEYTPSSYGNIFFDGAQSIGYKTLSEALINLTLGLSNSPSPSYFILYYEKIDSISHEYGPQSPQVEAEIKNFLLSMKMIFLKNISGNKKKVLFLLTADHGQADVDPKTTVYLNIDPRFSGIERFIKKNKNGGLLVPCGSARDFFLHIEEDKIPDAMDILSRGLKDKADVRMVSEMIDQGYFGHTISDRFRERIGNLVILPYNHESVWWFEKNKFEQRFYGHHGGLTRHEMEIPLITWEL